MEAFLSSDVTLNIKMLVLNLHGSMTEMAEGGGPGGARPVSYADALSKRAGCAAADLYLSCQLHAHGRPLGLPERTCNTPGSRLRWNEWITFRAKYCDLSPDAWIAITLVGSGAPRSSLNIGAAKISLFTDARQLRTGVVKVMFDVVAADGVAAAAVSKVDVGGGGVVVAPPSASSSSAAAGIGGSLADDETEIARLEELATRHENAMAHTDRALDWLNRPTYAHLERRQQEIGRRLERHFISVQLPELEYQVLFHEKLPPTLPVRLPPPSSSSTTSSSAAAAEKASAAASAANEKSGVGAAGLHDAPIVLLSDAEQHRDNPAVHKHHKLARSLLSAGFAKELKPDSEERRRLDSLVALPPTTRLREEDRYSVSQPHIPRHASLHTTSIPHHTPLSPLSTPPTATHAHRELMWKFRYSLTKEKRALTKLLKCVDWADTREVQQAQSLVEQWALVDVQVCCVFAC